VLPSIFDQLGGGIRYPIVLAETDPRDDVTHAMMEYVNYAKIFTS